MKLNTEIVNGRLKKFDEPSLNSKIKIRVRANNASVAFNTEIENPSREAFYYAIGLTAGKVATHMSISDSKLNATVEITVEKILEEKDFI